MKKMLMVVVMLFMAETAFAEWGRTAEESIKLPFYSHGISSDGAGGCWVTWCNKVTHVSRQGDLRWPDGLTSFPLPEGNHGYWGWSTILAEGDAAILGFTKRLEQVVSPRPGYEYDSLISSDVFIQKIDINGELFWGEAGIRLDHSDAFKDIQGIYHGPIENTYLFSYNRFQINGEGLIGTCLQLVNNDGEFLWGANGIRLRSNANVSHVVTSSDHCIIVAQGCTILKFNAQGELLWQHEVNMIVHDAYRDIVSDIESDRDGGVLAAFASERVDPDDDARKYVGVKVLRVSSEGDTLWTRQIFERDKIGFEDYWQINPFINYAGDGRYFVAWRNMAGPPYEFRTLALDSNGQPFWNEPTLITTTPHCVSNPEGVDSEDGVCYGWGDWGEGREFDHWQYWGQRVALDGERQWGDLGREIHMHKGDDQEIVSDNNGGAIVAIDDYLQMINRDGELGVVLPVSVDEREQPESVQLLLITYPSPFNASTTLNYSLPHHGKHELGIYDLSGRLIETLTQGVAEVGEHSVVWTAPGSGVYFAVLEVEGEGKAVRKVVCVR